MAEAGPSSAETQPKRIEESVVRISVVAGKARYSQTWDEFDRNRKMWPRTDHIWADFERVGAEIEFAQWLTPVDPMSAAVTKLDPESEKIGWGIE